MPHDNGLAPPVLKTQKPCSGSDNKKARAGIGLGYCVRRQLQAPNVPVAIDGCLVVKDNEARRLGKFDGRRGIGRLENGGQEPLLP